MRIQAILNDDTNFYFGEIEGDEGTAIIVDCEEFEINLYCPVEKAEVLAKQLQKHINKHKFKVVE